MVQALLADRQNGFLMIDSFVHFWISANPIQEKKITFESLLVLISFYKYKVIEMDGDRKINYFVQTAIWQYA